LEQLRARRDELEGHITELERLAVSPGE
jgi:hypothetical protein